ncbi:MAG TPA: GFA family protein [Dongiaceae bacterium]|jgi:hypothetical protein
MSGFKLGGGCQCGAVRYELRAPAHEVDHCHCSICRRLHGAMFASFALVPRPDFALLKGAEAITRYDSSPGCGRFFCSRCGSQIYSDVEQLPEMRFVTIGTLDGGAHPGNAPGTEHHIYVGSKAPWWNITDGLPQHDENKKD